jgi:HK97 gp10 family phage protein
MPAWGVQIREDTITPKLTGFTKRMRRNIADQFEILGEEMVDLARSIVPVRTGFLRDSIFHQVVESDLNLTFGATADYADYVEFGTSRMAARPYIRPAFDATEQKILDALLVGCMEALNV